MADSTEESAPNGRRKKARRAREVKLMNKAKKPIDWPLASPACAPSPGSRPETAGVTDAPVGFGACACPAGCSTRSDGPIRGRHGNRDRK